MLAFLNTSGVLVVIFFAVLYAFLILKARSDALKIIASVVMSGIVTIILKELFEVPRPFAVEGIQKTAGWAALSSFPSSHTALAFAAATSLTFRQKSIGILLFLTAIAIGYGRVIANVHYPKDIFFGIVIGISVAVFFENISFPKKFKPLKRR